jgi:hypothetical protein
MLRLGVWWGVWTAGGGTRRQRLVMVTWWSGRGWDGFCEDGDTGGVLIDDAPVIQVGCPGGYSCAGRLAAECGEVGLALLVDGDSVAEFFLRGGWGDRQAAIFWRPFCFMAVGGMEGAAAVGDVKIIVADAQGYEGLYVPGEIGPAFYFGVFGFDLVGGEHCVLFLWYKVNGKAGRGIVKNRRFLV